MLGAKWIIEGHLESKYWVVVRSKYWVVVRWSPEDSYKAAGLYFIELSGLSRVDVFRAE